MLAMRSENSMASNGTGWPSISTMLRRCRSPWQRRTAPAPARRATSSICASSASGSAVANASVIDWIEPLALLAHLANVGRHRAAIVVRPGKAADRRQSVVIGGNARAQRRHHLGRERAAVGHAVEQAVLVEAAHDDQPVDGIVGVLTDLAKAELAVAAAHGCGAEIDLRRQLVVDLDLGRAHRAAPFGRREIHVGELHGALQLVAALAG